MRKVFLLLTMLLSVSLLSYAQTRTITGKILGESGAPIPFASVAEKGTNRGTSADADGNFKVVTSTGAVLVVSATGYQTKEVAVGSGATLNVTLFFK